jgi:hypothetical protein
MSVKNLACAFLDGATPYWPYSRAPVPRPRLILLRLRVIDLKCAQGRDRHDQPPV